MISEYKELKELHTLDLTAIEGTIYAVCSCGRRFNARSDKAALAAGRKHATAENGHIEDQAHEMNDLISEALADDRRAYVLAVDFAEWGESLSHPNRLVAFVGHTDEVKIAENFRYGLIYDVADAHNKKRSGAFHHWLYRESMLAKVQPNTDRTRLYNEVHKASYGSVLERTSYNEEVDAAVAVLREEGLK